MPEGKYIQYVCKVNFKDKKQGKEWLFSIFFTLHPINGPCPSGIPARKAGPLFAIFPQYFQFTNGAPAFAPLPKKRKTSSHDHTQNRRQGKGGIRYPSVYSQNQTGLPPQDVFPDGVRNQGDPIEPT
ncbi:MAG: hypothetical protein GXY81_00745 [Candidatus Cloacimonetes bacterium]|nr:hypothetical protein [Candidatus Cloacimonadota bacterium]